MVTINKSNSITELETLISGLTLGSEATSNLVLILKTASLAGVDASSIKTELISRIDSANTGTSIEEITLLSASLPLISENRSISVADMTELNSLDVEAGTIVFVDNENVSYIRKSDDSWTLLFPNFQEGPKPNAYAWGEAVFGKLGDGTTVSKSSPVSIVGGFADWIELGGNTFHSVGLRADGTAWAWGLNNYGQLGDNTTTSRLSPVSVIGGFTDWTQLSAGGRHSLGLRSDGTAWAWGRGSYGRLGNDAATNRSSPVSVVGGFTDWTQLSAGFDHSLGLRADGTAWAWGLSNYGRLGDNSLVNKSSPVSVVGGFTDWTQLSAGGRQSAGLRADGTVWAWGINTSGRLGDNTTTSRLSPVSVVGGFTDWIQVNTGSEHSIGLRADGTAWTWGNNSSGKLGDNTTTNRSSPVSVVGGFTDWIQGIAGGAHSIGIRANGSAWGWGYNGKGQLGDGTIVAKSSPVSVIGGFNDWIQLSSGSGDHILGLRSA